MKTTRFFLLILFVFLCFSNGFAENKLHLKLKPGQTIEFSYSKSDIGNRNLPMFRNMRENEEKWIIELKVHQQLNNWKYVLELKPKRHIVNSYFTRDPNVHFDSMFPYRAEDAPQLKNSLIQYEIICHLKLKLGLDLNKNELIQLNNDEFQNNLQQQIKNKNLTNEENTKLFKRIAYELKEIQKNTSDYLLKFNNASLAKKDSLDLNKNDFVISRRSDGQIQFIKKVVIPENGKEVKHSYKTIINPRNGIVTESSHITNHPRIEHGRSFEPESTEKTNFTLLNNSEQSFKQVTISGYIENPEWRPIQIQVLDSPVGTEMNSYETVLDSTNHFTITIPYHHCGFVFVKNHNEYYPNRKFFSFKIYAEPGDTINFKLTGNKPSQRISYLGDRSSVNSVLFEKSVKTDKYLRYNGNLLLLPINLNIKQDDFLKEYAGHFNLFNTNWITDTKFSSEVSQKSKDFVIGELKMQKLALAWNLDRLKELFPDFGHDKEIREDFQKVESYIDKFEFCRYYHENAFYSRSAATQYAQYYIFKNLKYTTPIRSVSETSAGNFPFMNLYESGGYSKHLDLFLSGSALIHEKADILANNLNQAPVLVNINSETRFDKQNNLYQEIISSSQDTILNHDLDIQLQNLRKFLDGDFYSKRIFLKMDGDTVMINDFIGKKPTVLYVSQNWGNSRYYIDDLSEKYSDVNFIYLAKGNNFKEWIDYLKEAKPKAIQLFLNTDEHAIKDIFKFTKYGEAVIVFDRNGNVITYNADLNQIGKYIKQALNQPQENQEVNKSTLYGIIWFLGGSLLLGLIAFLIFKARMRLRLRKEKREKRLQELQLSAIRAQMNPHFLFNSLNSVQNLIQKSQGREAHLYLSDFAGLIRKVLKNSRLEEVSLAEELETLNQYIRLEQLRFDFEYEQTVDKQIDQNHFMVPSMILQPVAENAIMHGMQHKPDNRKLKVEIKKLDKAIQISVEDNGIGLEASKKIKSVSNGIGLNMNEERLQIMQEKYGGNYSFKLIDLTQQNKEGTRVEITIPEEE